LASSRATEAILSSPLPWNRDFVQRAGRALLPKETSYYSGFMIADLYADLGDKDRAFQWLDTAYQERDLNLLGLKTNFLLDPLRSDPRLAELVRKVGLPQ
jgi:hypothetical protein